MLVVLLTKTSCSILEMHNFKRNGQRTRLCEEEMNDSDDFYFIFAFSSRFI
jgi:hypothetical protein